MRLEEDLFLRLKPKHHLLEQYGFELIDDVYQYRTSIMNDDFEVIIEIKDDQINGKVLDLFSNEEYTLIHMPGIQGAYVSEVKKSYIKVLEDIAKKCFVETTFVSSQGNRINEYIINKYHSEAEFLWKEKKTPNNHAVFRHKDLKWFALVMYISKDKLTEDQGMVEVLNLKVGEDNIEQFLAIDGIYPSYHMNKKNWISIILDNTIDDDKIFNIIDLSYILTQKPRHKKEWIIPARSDFFDIEEYFDQEYVEWGQKADFRINDIVYIYVSKPYSCILYKCEVIQINLPYSEDEKVMLLHPIKKYDREEWTFQRIKQYGVRAVRGARSMTNELLVEMGEKT